MNTFDTHDAIQAILVMKNITKTFGTHVVLDDLSLAIERGKTTVILGPSGCGKTVLIKHLNCLLRPDSGEVWFNQRRIDQLTERELTPIRTQIGFLFQAGALFDSLTVMENILFPLQQHNRIKHLREGTELVKSKLAMVGLDGFQHHFPASLSGGQRKRVALARAIAMDPEVILYDEPSTGLDPIRSDIINELVLKLQRELHVTSIVVTHDMNSAYKIADRIIMLYNGRIIGDGDAEHIQNHPHPIIQQFIHGQISEEDMAVLRMSPSLTQPQFEPKDFSA